MNKKIIVGGKPESLSPNQVYVKQGETLSEIALRVTGSAKNWKQIAEANNLTDANKIKPGQVITIPESIWNPVVANVEGKEYRWRDPEYRKIYPKLVSKTSDNELATTLPGVTVDKSNLDLGQVVNRGTTKFGEGLAHTFFNGLDMPRRLIAAATNDDYSLMDAVNIVGKQKYKSVTGDKFAAENPWTAAGIDILAGLILPNAMSIGRSITRNAGNLARTSSAVAGASDDFARISQLPPKQLQQATAATRQSTRSTIARNPNQQYETLVIHPTNTGTQATKTVSNTPINTTVGARVDVNRGINTSGGFKSSRTNVGRGNTTSAYTSGSPNIGGAHYPIPVFPTIYPKFVPSFGIPNYYTPPQLPPQPQRARIETVNPGQITLDEIIRQSGAKPGDIIQLPNGEQIKYIPGNTTAQRVFNISDSKTYDAADVPENQYYIPGRTQRTWTKSNQSANTYIPAVPLNEERQRGVYYPTILQQKPKYKPL